jgi:hypothetical protein
MKKIICDVCEIEIKEKSKCYILNQLVLSKDGFILIKIINENDDLDFCSLKCLQVFIIHRIGEIKDVD